MGMYDTIRVYMQCPDCKNFTTIYCQTKDFDCQLWEFSTLPDDWFDDDSLFGKKFYDKAPVFKSFPFDITNSVWKSVSERNEAEARVPIEFKDLEYVNVVLDCDLCNRGAHAKGKDYKFLRGKIKIQNGFLIGEVFDIKE